MNTNYKSLILAISVFLALSAPISAAPGDLDPTFGVGGKIIWSGGGSYDVAIQPDGKIVTVGSAVGGSEVTQIAVARYNIDGSPDTTFGGTGRVFIDHYQIAVDVAIQPDGKIVVASRDPDGDVFGELIRLNSDGSLDTSFGTNGIVSPLFVPSVAAILPDGKLLIASAATLFRLNANGSSDMTFSPCRPRGSTVHYAYRRSESVIQPDGRILTEFTAGNNDFGVFRCNPDGTLDTGFGSGGAVITSMNSGIDVAQSIALQLDGKIVVTGQSQTQSWSEWKFTVLRYNPNGSLDSGFGTGGILTTPTGTNFPYFPPPSKVVLQTDGKILVATTIVNGSSHFDLVRYNPDGSLDTTFTPITNGNDYAHSVAIQADGKIVVAGAGQNGTDFYGLLVRYQGDATGSSCSNANPIDCADFFISQQYRDFLGREPDSSGFANWMATLTGCPNSGYGEFDSPWCDRIHVSAGFVQSHEFQGRGYWILRYGFVGLNRSIGSVRSAATYAEFTPALAQIGGSNSPAQEEAAKVTYTNAFVQRPDFLALFPTTMTASQYVNALETNAQVTLPNKQSLIDALNAGTMTRADVLRNVVESQVVFDKYIIPAFVTMEYFGYLRRDPDMIGYQNWVNTLTAEPNNYRHMIFGFIYSTEYRQRFGPN